MTIFAGQRAKNADICFVVPPFDSILFPPLGVSVLASSLMARGFSVRIVYGSLLLATRMGVEAYRSVCNGAIKELLGERLFLSTVYSPEALATLGPQPPFTENAQALFDQNVPLIEPFVRTLARQVLATKPKIVGISTNFQQNMASIAVARLIKDQAPDICIVLGGANISSPMGDELAKVFPWIDHFFSGEADTAFPEFCEELLRATLRSDDKVIHCPPINDMGSVSAPDFTDYFRSLRHFQKRRRLPETLPEFLTMESSRGCWWGEKNHCTFCGLNADGMEFRKKLPDVVEREIRSLTARWSVNRVHFSDNIMPTSYFNDLLPALEAWPEHPRLFFEVKANLKDEQLRLMARAGIDTIQPGIEALSTHVLKLMRKGVSALQNVALLRSARSVGVSVVWNLLYGLPGERKEDYEAYLWLIPKITHLYPPSGLNKVIIDRYSPYHFDHQAYGIASIEPFASYAAIYPAKTALSDIAYHFGGDFTTPVLDDAAFVETLRKAVARWRNAWQDVPRLDAIEVNKDRWMIADTRPLAKKKLVAVSGEAMAALACFERPRPRGGLHDGHAAEIEELLAHDFLIAYEGALLSLVTRERYVKRFFGESKKAAIQQDAMAGAA